MITIPLCTWQMQLQKAQPNDDKRVLCVLFVFVVSACPISPQTHHAGIYESRLASRARALVQFNISKYNDMKGYNAIAKTHAERYLSGAAPPTTRDPR
jgi:hypothetical protein